MSEPLTPAPRWAARAWTVRARVTAQRLGQRINRALGLAAVVTRLGPARRRPWFQRALLRLGVLQSDPGLAQNAPVLERLPWGRRPLDADPAQPPPGVEGMWPQPAVVHPGLYPPVLHISDAENDVHVRKNALRYLGQIITLTPGAILRARLRRRVYPMDDACFAEILTRTSLSQHLRYTFTADDHDAFGPWLAHPPGELARMDLTGVPVDRMVPGVQLGATVVLFHHQGQGRFAALAIRCNDEVFTPGDGDAWTLAQRHVLSAIHVQHTVIIHPRLHFPGDTINAVTKTMLPADHPVARLIRPHTRASLGLNRAVIHHRRSVLWNSGQEVYTALPIATDAVIDAVVVGRQGRPGGDAYAPYDFWGIPHDPRTNFGRFCQAWQDAFERFATAICADVPLDDPALRGWADAIAAWVPGFPDARAIARPGMLGRALGRTLAVATVLHAADHYSYAAIPIQYMPIRLRQPAPTHAAPARADLATLTHPEDTYRHHLCHRMFFAPVVFESLDQVRYDFTSAPARAAVDRFRAEQRAIDQRWRHHGLPTTREIASSIQY